MSATIASAWPLSAQAPSTLAAGPDNTVPTGRLSAPRHIDQRAVALHHHQRRVDAVSRQRAAHGFDQRLHMRDHARIERHRQRAPRRAQAGCQFMAAGHRLVAQFLDQRAHLQLVLRIAHAEAGRNGERRYPGRLAHDGLARAGLVDRHQRKTAGVVAAGQGHDGVRAQQLDQTAGLDLRRVVTGQQHAHRRALALDHRVGRQRGRQGHQIDIAAAWLRQLVQRAADADRTGRTAWSGSWRTPRPGARCRAAPHR